MIETAALGSGTSATSGVNGANIGAGSGGMATDLAITTASVTGTPTDQATQ